MTAFSAGPWRVADHGSGLGIRDAQGRRVASLRYAGSSVSARVPVGENIANARLMAAAPDLLAALRACSDALAGWVEIAEDRDMRDSDTEALALADMAIRRATEGGN